MPKTRDELYTNAFAAVLKAERCRRIWSLDDMAKRCQVTRSGLYAWERGHCAPTFGNILKIAEVFGVTLSAMMSAVEHEASLLEKFNDHALEPTVLYTGNPGDCGASVPCNSHVNTGAVAESGANRGKKSSTRPYKTPHVDTSVANLLNLLSDLNIHTENFAEIAGVHRSTAFRWLGAQATIPVSVIRMLELMRDKHNKV